MDWKSYYDEELREAGIRDRIMHWLRVADKMALSSSKNDRRTVFSFPHTAIDYSGPLQARVVSWLVRSGFKRVIALGVMHGSLIPVHRTATNELAPQDERLSAFAQISGAFLPTTEQLKTPFGDLAVSTEVANQPPEIRRDLADLLKDEFSLDTFFGMLRLAADLDHIEPLHVTPFYIGMTRNPVTGSFEIARAVARWLLDQWDDETAIVTTGDVVHYGTVYGSEVADAALEQLESQFRHQLETLLGMAFREAQMEEAYQIAQCKLKSDQREILPLLVYLLGEKAVANIEVFALSDYANILKTAPPCLVSSALIAYKHGGAE